MAAARPTVKYLILCAIIICAALFALLGQRKGEFFLGLALDGYPITEKMLDAAREQSGIAPSFILFFVQWPSDPAFGEVPSASLEEIWKQGSLPIVTWEPFYSENGIEHMIAAEDILSGRYDQYILAIAGYAAKAGKPVVVRFAHEMNLERYHWGTPKERYGPESPELYRRMFRYVVDKFRQAHAANVLWAFSPNAESVPDTPGDPHLDWNAIRNYYPGNAYADILGMDGYNWGDSQNTAQHGWDSSWKSFRQTFAAIYSELRRLSSSKPIVVFETGSVAAAGDKERWFRDALTTARKWNISGIVWFQANKEQDWRINVPADLRPGFTQRSRTAALDWAYGLRN